MVSSISLLADATQSGRLLELQTPLGKDKLLINAFGGVEAVSGMFRFQLDMLASQPVTMQDLLQKSVSLSVRLPGSSEDTRYFHGIVSSVSTASRTQQRVYGYKAEVVPWLWLLTRKSTSRIFQDKTVLEIMTEVFNELKAVSPDVKFRDDTMLKHTPLDYCVQYRESDFNFVSRLMEQEGIFYYFEHAKDGHTLVFTDHNSRIPDDGLSFKYSEGGTDDGGEFINHWEERVAVISGKVTMRDQHFQLPKRDLEVTQQGKNGASPGLEVYDSSGQYATGFLQPEQRLGEVSPEGDKTVNIRMEEVELPGHMCSGSSSCRHFGSGKKFALTGHPDSDGDYIAMSVHHSIRQSPDYFSKGSGGDTYRNHFSCVPVAVAVRPARITPKPTIPGPQTAVVAVKSGQDSWLDKFGRVRVQFHWERAGKNNETSACWVRVSQPWAGGSWGAHFWPRVGQEVVVEFLEGDPDRPLITGSVYNAGSMPPYELPANYTRSGIMTRSNKTGGSANFNEIRFEDKLGQEQFFVNAERDMDQRVENDLRIFVGGGQNLIIQQAQKELVEKGDSSREVKAGSHAEKIKNVYTLEAGSEIHLSSPGTIVIDAKRVSVVGEGGFIDISGGIVTIHGDNKVNINCSGGSPAQGTPANPEKPDTADDGSKGGKL